MALSAVDIEGARKNFVSYLVMRGSWSHLKSPPYNETDERAEASDVFFSEGRKWPLYLVFGSGRSVCSVHKCDRTMNIRATP